MTTQVGGSLGMLVVWVGRSGSVVLGMLAEIGNDEPGA